MKWFSLYEFFHIGVEVLETTYIILKVEPDNYLNWLQLKDFFWWWIYFASICLKICIKSAVLLWYLHGDRFVCWFFIVYINYTMWISYLMIKLNAIFPYPSWKKIVSRSNILLVVAFISWLKWIVPFLFQFRRSNNNNKNWYKNYKIPKIHFENVIFWSFFGFYKITVVIDWHWIE